MFTPATNRENNKIDFTTPTYNKLLTAKMNSVKSVGFSFSSGNDHHT